MKWVEGYQQRVIIKTKRHQIVWTLNSSQRKYYKLYCRAVQNNMNTAGAVQYDYTIDKFTALSKEHTKPITSWNEEVFIETVLHLCSMDKNYLGRFPLLIDICIPYRRIHPITKGKNTTLHLICEWYLVK